MVTKLQSKSFQWLPNKSCIMNFNSSFWGIYNHCYYVLSVLFFASCCKIVRNNCTDKHSAIDFGLCFINNFKLGGIFRMIVDAVCGVSVRVHYDDVAWEFKVLSLRYTRQSWSILYQLAQSKFSHSVSNILRDYVKYLNFGFIFHSICKCARISNHSFTRGSKISCDSFDSTSYFTNWSFAVSRCKKIPVDFKIECLFKPWKASDNEFCFVYGITEIRFAPTFAWGDHDLH